MKHYVMAAALMAGMATGWAQPPQVQAHEDHQDQLLAQAAAAADLSEGEVRKVDKAGRKITIRHGEIKNLDMPPMTMVFGVSDPALLAEVKAGDKVQFRAVDSGGGALLITQLQVSK